MTANGRQHSHNDAKAVRSLFQSTARRATGTKQRVAIHVLSLRTPRRMKNFPLVLLLVICTVFIVALNLTSLKSVIRHADLKNVEVNDIPILSDNSKPKFDKKATKKKSTHQVAGLNCDKFGGPSEEIAAEMIYWRDIPTDADFVSPFASHGKSPKYLTFEPDEGGWNNIRMSMETATVLAHAMGRTLVLPPEQQMYLLWQDKKHKNNQFTFKDFFHFDSIAEEHASVEVISMQEFMRREAMTGNLVDKSTGQVSFPPNNETIWNGHGRKGRKHWLWMRSVTAAPIWSFDNCVAGFASEPGKDGVDRLRQMNREIKPGKPWYTADYTGHPTPVDGPPSARLREQLGDRRKICFYNETLQEEKVVHFMGDNDSGARLLVHFYAYLFFENYHQDLWTKRFVRDHLRYIDEIQCTAARVVHAMRQKAIENGNPDGAYDSFHIRRGDFQYKDTRISCEEIYENTKLLLSPNSTIFIATDEKDSTFFEPLRQHYNIYFLDDFKDLLNDINKNYLGMLDQRVASRGRTFIGAYYSTFTGYINRMRGYHSQKDKLKGYERGEINSYYYVPKRHQRALRTYMSIHGPMWAREFPVAWRDIDHDLDAGALDDNVETSR